MPCLGLGSGMLPEFLVITVSWDKVSQLTLIPKPDIIKENSKPLSFINTDAQILNKILAN